MKLVKGEKVRFVDDNDELVEALKGCGYVVEGEKANKKDHNELDRDKLKSEADALDIDYPKNIKTEKLYQLVFEAKASA